MKKEELILKDSSSKTLENKGKPSPLAKFSSRILKLEKWQIALIIIILILAISSRLIFLDSRPLHSDESVNWFFAEKIINSSGFSYDPVNYHGPLYFFLLALSIFLFGSSPFSLRLVPAIFGILLVILPLFLKFNEEPFDKYGKYIASLFILVSPSILYYSRYSIHEIVFVLFSFLAFYFLNKILEKNNLDYLPYFAACFALIFTLKETAIFMAFTLLVICLFNFKKIRQISWKGHTNLIILSLIIFICIWTILFSSFFTDISGISNSIRAFFFWADQGVNSGHVKPFYYFITLLLKYEFPIFILALVGIFYSFKNKNIFYKNVSIWFILMFLIYSTVPYKTPWLVTNITLPMCLLAAISVISIYESFNKNKFILIFILCACIIYLSIFSIQTSFFYPWQESNSFAYVHTDKSLLNMVQVIKNTTNPKILILSKEYWPLPFYLQNMNIYYLDPKKISDYKKYLEDYNLIIAEESLMKKDSSNLTVYITAYTLRPGVPIYLIQSNGTI